MSTQSRTRDPRTGQNKELGYDLWWIMRYIINRSMHEEEIHTIDDESWI
jgi:hypothetical protein